jgi:hypothetical protein
MSFIIAESGSTNAIQVAYCPLPQYHVRRSVFYIAIFEFKRLSNTPKWITMREKEDAIILPSCVKIKNRLREVLTLLDFTSHSGS